MLVIGAEGVGVWYPREEEGCNDRQDKRSANRFVMGFLVSIALSNERGHFCVQGLCNAARRSLEARRGRKRDGDSVVQISCHPRMGYRRATLPVSGSSVLDTHASRKQRFKCVNLELAERMPA